MRLLPLLTLLLLVACGGHSPHNNKLLTELPPEGVAEKCAATAEPGLGEHWVNSWMTAPTDAQISRPLAGQTERQFIAPHWDGDVVRLRLQNRYGATAVTLSNVQLAKQDVGANVIEGSNCQLSFAGSDSVTIQPGESVASDPIHFDVNAFEKIAVDFYVPGTIDQPSRHLDAREIPYTSTPGDFSGQADGSPFLPSEFNLANNWLLLEGLDVVAPSNVGVVVAVGDSITDGATSFFDTFGADNMPEGTNLDQRYPDYLARRLLAANRPLSVANAGIGGNELTGAGLAPQYGEALLLRYPKDVLAVPGVTDVVIMIGTNDFGNDASTTAEEVINGYNQLVSDLQAHGLNVIAGTIPPAAGFPVGQLPAGIGVLHGSSTAAANRAAVNEWIRTSGVPDGVVDFKACLEDPDNPGVMLPAYDSGDRLHPNPAGYEAMAACIDLALFSR
ncbi:MAG: GDSL-type esterase/lipase family protein [Gammaproteobacteria bacterium]|nr:GDSL-type esterase/lipase family protein [Gammaproteobacteria bacterium]